ncbi:MAG: D-tyrosyl-tRNA(Tyr) deacylase [Actinomycetales bacterium]|nr:D-tyrosyl-tRNA(Tyr) deacylase [Candidatus Phosphoribacter baldrii]
MRVVLQRVSSARVEVEGAVVGDLGGPGLVALVGVTHGEGPTQVDWMARKIAGLRIFDGADGDDTPGAERSVAEAGLPVLVVSQFTLYADVRKGRRPSWSAAAPGSVAEPLVDALAAALRAEGLTVASGTFGAHMMVHLVNDGPVTLVLDV